MLIEGGYYMISVLTLTYKRHHLLEEAIESFLRQDFSGESEMLIINDSGHVQYILGDTNIRIINLEDRFSSIGEKLGFGFSQCKYDYIYRLDDDDLMAPWALRNTWDDIINYPNYDIYRSNGHYSFINNKYEGISSNVNNGNVYTKSYLSRIEIPSSSFGEDYEITFNQNAQIYESNRVKKTMIYRWGMNTYHISGMGNIGQDAINKWTDRIVNSVADSEYQSSEQGILLLQPHFDSDYYKQIEDH